MVSDRSSPSASAGLPRATAFIALGIGLLALAGWLFDAALLKSMLPGAVAMKSNTAIGFVLSGVVLWLLDSLAPLDARRRRLLQILAAAIIALAALSLSQDVFSWDLGIDQWLFREPAGAAGTAHPGRMAPNTAICFILIAASSIMLSASTGSRRSQVRLAVQCLSALVAGIAALALLRYAVGMPLADRWKGLTPMAVPTAVGCAALAIGMFAVAMREDGEWAIDKRVTAAFLVSLLLTLMVSSLSARTTVGLQEANRLLAHTHEVRFQNSEILAALERMEAAQRGFLLTGQREFLQPYVPAVREVVAQTALLLRLTSDNPAQQGRLRLLDRSIAARLRYAAGTLQLYRLRGPQAALERVRLGRGRHQMEAIRDILSSVDAEELRLVRVRQARSEGSSAAVFMLLPAGGLLSLLVLSVGLLFLNREAAERKRAESERDRFFTLSLDLLCVADADGYFKRLSPAFTETLGWSIDELLARPFLDFVHPDDHVATLAEVQRQVLAGESVLQFENRYLHKDGSWRVLSWKSVPASDRRMYATARDVTEARHAEVRIVTLNLELTARQVALEAANKDMESFSYSVSHDLRAPLRHIDGYARMLSEDAAGQLPEESQRFLRTIMDSARRMGMLIDDLLAFSRLGRKALAVQPVDMQELVERALEEAADGKDCAARVEVEPLPPAEGDPALLRQVWANLLSNAIKYSAPRGDRARIVVAAERKGDRVHYAVRDNGVGFDMRYADKLFGVFQRLHAQEEFEGTGVGLAIVQRIVQRHGGTVTASSEPDRGACFGFDLPACEVTP